MVVVESSYALQNIQKEIDRMLENRFTGVIYEHTYPPYQIVRYLMSTWGFGNPVHSFTDHYQHTTTFKLDNAFGMTVYMEIGWETGFRKGFRLIKKTFTT